MAVTVRIVSRGSRSEIDDFMIIRFEINRIKNPVQEIQAVTRDE